MLLSTIRSNLAALLAVAAAIFAGYAYITHLHHQATKAQLEEVRAERSRLARINMQQTATIEALSDQRDISDSILEAVARQSDVLNTQGSNIEQSMRELGNNDSTIQDLRGVRLPSSVIRLLREAAGNNPDANGDSEAP